MSIEFTCVCGKRYRVDDKLAGKRVRCKACGKPMLVEELVDLAAAMVSDSDQHTDGANDPPPGPPPIPGGWDAPAQSPSQAWPAGSTSAAPRWIAPEIPGATPGSWQTMASNPALLKLHPLVYLKNYPGPLIVLAGWLLIASPYLLGSYPWIGLIIAMLGVAWFLFNMWRMSRKVGHGCVNPAMVVSTQPWRLAIYTDLSTGGGERPAIKVIRAPLGRIDNGQLRVGSQVAVVALYAPSAEPDAWGDIDETIIPFVTDRPEQVERILGSITAKDWRDFERLLPGVDTSRTGLYKLWKTGKDRFTAQDASTVWVVFAIFCAVVFTIGFATWGNEKPVSAKPTVHSESPAAAPSGVTTPKSPVVSTPRPAPTAPTPGTSDLGRPVPSLNGDDLQRMMRADRDESLEKVTVFIDDAWRPGRVVKRDAGLAFVHLDGTNRGKWFRADQLRPR